MTSNEDTTVITKKEDISKDADKGTPYFIIIHGKDIGRVFELHKEELSLGRSETSDIRLDEENVSRHHATVICKGDEVLLRDEKSTNGTFVNTKKIEKITLRDGDLILVGNTILKFVSSAGVESQYHEEIYRLATLDGLTQVYNKKHVWEKGTVEFARSRRYQRDLSLILYDFDHFKKINDTYGHAAGDYVLKHAAEMIKKTLRKEDIFGRYGGEEFMIILPETKLENAASIGEKIRLLVSTLDYNYEGTQLKVTVSVGVASMNAATHSFKDLFNRADSALYRAKEEGRNRSITAS